MNNQQDLSELNSDPPYKVGSIVPEDGYYVCVPCGGKKYLKAGTKFASCLMCLGKERRAFRRGFELWEKWKSK